MLRLAICTLSIITIFSCTAPRTLMKPSKRDGMILYNNPPIMIIENYKGRLKRIYFPCDSCKVGSYMIYE